MTCAQPPVEVIIGIQDRLSVLTDLFNFYQTIEDNEFVAGFRAKTFNGLVGIIDDCIDKLEVLKKNETD